MTDITDQDRRQLREDAKAVINKTAMRSSAAVSIARYILATVDAPVLTLAEELRDVADNYGMSSRAADRLHDIADRMEHDLAEARAEVERERDLGVALAHERDEARAEAERLNAQNAWPKTTPSGHTYDAPTTYKELRHQCANAAQAASEGWDDAECPPEPTWEMVGLATAEVERLTAERDTEGPDDNDWLAGMKEAARYAINATRPDPAEVKPGEAWIVECHGECRTAVKDRDDDEPWNTSTAVGLFFPEDNEAITLVSRLVPAPRTITNHDDLDRAKRDTIIRDARGVVCSRDCMGHAWTTFTSLADQRPHIALPATVLWEPEA